MYAYAKLGSVCNILSPVSLLLHWSHVSSPKGAPKLCHNSSPSNLHQGTVFTRASKEDHFLEKWFKYLTWYARGVGAVRARCKTVPRGA